MCSFVKWICKKSWWAGHFSNSKCTISKVVMLNPGHPPAALKKWNIQYKKNTLHHLLKLTSPECWSHNRESTRIDKDHLEDRERSMRPLILETFDQIDVETWQDRFSTAFSMVANAKVSTLYHKRLISRAHGLILVPLTFCTLDKLWLEKYSLPFWQTVTLILL